MTNGRTQQSAKCLFSSLGLLTHLFRSKIEIVHEACYNNGGFVKLEQWER